MEILIITGMSGAGKSTVLNYFEDRGYMTIDNMPCFLLDKEQVLTYKERIKFRKSIKNIAIGIDIRSFKKISEFLNLLKNFKEQKISCKVIYLDAKDEILLNRYNLTRRYHPLQKSKSIAQNIYSERKILEDVREISDLIIDTSYLTTKDLVSFLRETFKEKREQKQNLTLTITTFGFKYGIPIDLDMMFDTRCLPNPHYIKELRPKTGNDKEVQEYVLKNDESIEYLNKIKEMLEFLLPYFIKEGKSHLTVGIGCSGGKHRSVTLANKIYDHFKTEENIKVLLNHREKETWN